MSLADAFAPAIDHYRNVVIHKTFGHLAAPQGEKFKGTMIFACADYGGTMSIIQSDFPEVDDSPWFHSAMSDCMNKHIDKLIRAKKPHNGLFKFEGTYCLQKNGHGRMSGKVRRIDIKKL